MRQTYYDDDHSNGNHRNPNSIPNQDANIFRLGAKKDRRNTTDT